MRGEWEVSKKSKYGPITSLSTSESYDDIDLLYTGAPSDGNYDEAPAPLNDVKWTLPTGTNYLKNSLFGKFVESWKKWYIRIAQ